MLGSIISRILILALGYVYPAYECFKIVEANKPSIAHLQFWCQYWILVAGITVCERVGDTLFFWIPLYGEGKVTLFVYLWHPKTKGATHVYRNFFRPFLAKHEAEIDKFLKESRNNFKEVGLRHMRLALEHGQARFVEVLQYVATRQHKVPNLETRTTKEPEERNFDNDVPTINVSNLRVTKRP